MPARFVPIFAPEVSAPRLLRAAPSQPALLTPTPYPTLAELEPSPEPPLVADGITEPMALPPLGFAPWFEEEPCPFAPISYDATPSPFAAPMTESDDILLGGHTEPMHPPEPSARVVFIVLDNAAQRASEQAALPSDVIDVPPLEPSSSLRLSLLPPPLLLTPPHWAPIEAPVVVAEPAVLRELPAELPNPWASETRREAAPLLLPPGPEPKLTRSLAFRLGRAAALTLLAAFAGAGVHAALLRTLPKPSRPAPAPSIVALAAPVAPPLAAASAAPNATAVTATRPEGDVEVLAPQGVPVLVDGILRGNGPRVALRIAPGYHMIRAGAKRTQLAEVRAGTTAHVDLTAAAD